MCWLLYVTIRRIGYKVWYLLVHRRSVEVFLSIFLTLPLLLKFGVVLLRCLCATPDLILVGLKEVDTSFSILCQSRETPKPVTALVYMWGSLPITCCTCAGTQFINTLVLSACVPTINMSASTKTKSQVNNHYLVYSGGFFVFPYQSRYIRNIELCIHGRFEASAGLMNW